MDREKQPRGELTGVAALLLLVLIMVGSFGGFMLVKHWRDSLRRAQISHNLKQLRLSLEHYQSKQVDEPVSK